MSAAVMHQVELDIAATAVELEITFALGVGHGLALGDDWLIGWHEMVAYGLHEGEGLIETTCIKVVEKDAADAAWFVAMRKEEVSIANIFEF